MAIEPNKYLLSRALYEAKGQRETALKELNAAMGEKLGKEPFHSFNKEVFLPNKQRDAFSRFHLALAHHLYHPRPMGSSDFLSVPYAKVFQELWDWYPNLVWIIELFIKDFNKPSLEQLYIAPVPEDQYGDGQSPGEIGQLLKKNRLAGLLALSSDNFLAYGIPVLDLDQVETTNSRNWRGLKEFLLKNVAPIPYPSALPGPYTIWENMHWVFPEKVVEKGLDMLFGDFSRDRTVLNARWKAFQKHTPFVKAFALAIQKCQKLHPELIAHWPDYLAIRADDPALFATELEKVLVQPEGFGDFVSFWFSK